MFSKANVFLVPFDPLPFRRTLVGFSVKSYVFKLIMNAGCKFTVSLRTSHSFIILNTAALVVFGNADFECVLLNRGTLIMREIRLMLDYKVKLVWNSLPTSRAGQSSMFVADYR
jgi:hypothetical protein